MDGYTERVMDWLYWDNGVVIICTENNQAEKWNRERIEDSDRRVIP